MAEEPNKDPALEKKPEAEGAPAEGAGADGGGVNEFDSFVPEVRKTPADYFRERHTPSREAVPPKEGEGDGQGEELTAGAKQLLASEVERQVRERMQPYEKVIVDSTNDGEINSYLGSHEDQRKFAPVARKFMDAYKGITAEYAFLLAEAKFGNPAQRGADEQKRRDAADKKARGGSSPRPPQRTGSGEITAEEITAMTPEQFAAFNERIKGGAQIKTT